MLNELLEKINRIDNSEDVEEALRELYVIFENDLNIIRNPLFTKNDVMNLSVIREDYKEIFLNMDDKTFHHRFKEIKEMYDYLYAYLKLIFIEIGLEK